MLLQVADEELVYDPVQRHGALALVLDKSGSMLAAVDPTVSSGPGSEVRATAWGADAIAHAELRVDEGPWLPMFSTDGSQFSAAFPQGKKAHRVEVQVTDRNGSRDCDAIKWDPIGNYDRTPSGSDKNSIGAWPERHLFGTQLGPNRNGRKW